MASILQNSQLQFELLIYKQAINHPFSRHITALFEQMLLDHADQSDESQLRSYHWQTPSLRLVKTSETARFCQFGIPHSDCGGQFKSALMHELCRVWKVNESQTASYELQASAFDNESFHHLHQAEVPHPKQESQSRWKTIQNGMRLSLTLSHMCRLPLTRNTVNWIGKSSDRGHSS